MQHDRSLRTSLNSPEDCVFNCDGHPVLRRNRNSLFRETLAWARIDLELETNEALIEEIQTDWIRLARWTLERADRAEKRGKETVKIRGTEVSINKLRHYVANTLTPYAECWNEAMLSAAIEVLWNEIGVETIYLHTFETGKFIKHIDWSAPPRSIYSRLPRRFCFEEVKDAPGFLIANKQFRKRYRKLENPGWFRLIA